MAKKVMTTEKKSSGPAKKINLTDADDDIKKLRDVLDFSKNKKNKEDIEKAAEKMLNKASETETIEETPKPYIDESTQTEPDQNAVIQNENKEVMNETAAEPIKQTPEVANNTSLFDDMSSITQEDIAEANKPDNFEEKTNVQERLESTTEDSFVTNDGATEEEDTPEYRAEMAKIKASALVEFFDVIFMIICLVISKDFSDNAQKRFSLVSTRKNAIKSNVYEILKKSKKKHNPMATIFFLIIFSYTPLIVIAVMERIKAKKEEQERKAKAIADAEKRQREETAKQRYYNEEQNTSLFRNIRTDDAEPKKETRGRKPKPKIIQIEENSGAKVKQMKNGDFKNLDTGEVYKGGRGRKPKWMSSFGKIG